MTGSRNPRVGENQARSRGRVLLAEDDDAFRQLVADVLMREGYRVTAVASGVELFYMLTVHPADSYDVVLSDVRMSGFTGLEVLAATPPGERPPFVLFSGFADAETSGAAMRAGVSAFLSKPFDLRELAPLLDVAVSTYRRDRKAKPEPSPGGETR